MSNNRAASSFPYVKPSSDHTVLYKIPPKHASDIPLQPHQTFLGDRWDDDHVRMPHSKYNQYEKGFFSMSTESRWDVIKKALSKDINNIDDLTKAILKYNGKFKEIWKFQALHHYLYQHLTKKERKDFFRNILPGIIKLALKLPDLIQAPLPLLRQFQNKSISLSQVQIASLLANAFLCTFPWRNTAYQNTTYAKLPKINFTLLYESTDESVFQKLQCIRNYFKRVISEPPTGVVTFSRRFVPPYYCPDWEHSTDLIRDVPIFVDSELNIEDAQGQIQVDFANKFLGGGVLGTGLVQEEIRFLICPELMASMLFTESLTDQEALMIIGCERYNNYTGYGRETFRWAGDHQDRTPFDTSRRRQCAVLAIDALPYWDQRHQFKKHMILRELTKAWIGFTFFQNNSKHLQYPAVATGNWGCGAFNGVPQLKCLIQMMAAAAAKRPLMYYTFGDQHHAEEVETAYGLCTQHSVTVGKLFKSIMEYDYYTKTDLHSFLMEKIDDKLEKYRSRDTAEDKSYENKKNESEERHAQTKESYAQKAGSSTGYDPRLVDTQKGTHKQRNNKDNHSSYVCYNSQHKKKCDKTSGNCTQEPTRRLGQHPQNYAKGRGRGRGSDHSQKDRKYSGPSRYECLDHPRSNYDQYTNQTPRNPMPDLDPTQKWLTRNGNKKNCSAQMHEIFGTLPHSSHEWMKIAEQFERRWNFPHCLGAIDGKHVVIQSPIHSGSEYINYKSTFSIVLLALVDADYNFIFVDCGCQGRISDGGVYKNTELYKKICRNELDFPLPDRLPLKEEEMPYVFVADSAFALTLNMMKPYAGNHNKGTKERVFNYRLSRARRIVENVFGIMSAVFRVLRKPILIQPDKVTDIVMTCVLLHNFLRRSKKSRSIYTPVGSFDTDNEGVIQPGSWRKDQKNMSSLLPIRALPRRASLSAKAVRNKFAEYFVTNGAVSWQNNY